MPQKNNNPVYIKCGSEHFELSNVSIIKSFISLAFIPIPGLTSIVKGLINFEGEIIPLLNFTDEILPEKNIKTVVLDSDDGVFAVAGELILSKKNEIEFKRINYKYYF